MGRIEPTGQAEEELGAAAERAFVGGPTSRLVKDCTLGAPFAGARGEHRGDRRQGVASRDLGCGWRPGRSNAGISLSPGLLNVKFLLDAHRLHKGWIVADDHQRTVEFAERLFEQFHGLNVEVVGWLVEDQEPWRARARQRARKSRAQAFPT